MGPTMQWRQPPDRVDRLYADHVTFGRGRGRGTGYLAHSDRVGPGILLIGEEDRARADEYNAQGFTVLVPDYSGTPAEAALLQAAASYLSENWHPRIAVVAVGALGAAGASLLVERDTPLDVLVLFDAVLSKGLLPEGPVVGHFSGEVYSPAVQLFFETLLERGLEVEVYVYGNGHPKDSAVARSRTVDALEYHLS